MVELKFIVLLTIALYFVFKPGKKKVPFILNGEETPLEILEFYTGLLRLHGVPLSPEAIEDAYYTQRFKMINNHQPGDASIEELEAAKEYLLTRCMLKGCLN